MNIVLFDGVCNLCNSTVQFLIKYDRNNQLLFAAQQNEVGQKLLEKHSILGNANSVILIKGEQVFYKTDAVIEIAKLISGWPQIIKYSFIFPKWFRDLLYDLVAKYRYRIFGKRKECSVPSELHKHKFLHFI